MEENKESGITQTYADIVNRKRVTPPPINARLGKKKIQPIQRHTIIVTCNKDGIAPETMKKEVQNCVDPKSEKLYIKQCKKIKTDKLLIETESARDAEVIPHSQVLTEKGYTVTKQTKKLPRIIIYDVPAELERDQLTDIIIKQNNLETEKHETINPLFKVGKNNSEIVHWVLEVSPTIRNDLCYKKRIYIGWQRCRVADYLIVVRCYRCQGLGHIAKYCSAETTTCGRCLCEDHRAKECTSKNTIKKCIPCKKAGKSDDHSMNNNCPIYKQVLSRQINNTDYG